MSIPLPWSVQVLTLFPEMFPGPLGHSLAGKALGTAWSLNTIDIRSFTEDKHKTVDDTAFGGGPGMVLKPDIIDMAVKASIARAKTSPSMIYLSPRGEQLNQKLVKQLIETPDLVLLCGRYEGVDQRVLDAHNFREISLGDFVLSGGEIAALALLDACVRLLPNVMGDQESGEDESFSHGLLEYPHYTRPQNWQGHMVPEVLTSGHHQQIKQWRQQQSEQLTKMRRPDLWQNYLNNQYQHQEVKG